MNIYFPYGLVAIGMSMYAFYIYRRRRKQFSLQRRTELKDTRQEWLDHQLGRKTSDIILYGQFMDRKITALSEVGKNIGERESYYLDNNTGEKWIKDIRIPKCMVVVLHNYVRCSNFHLSNGNNNLLRFTYLY